MSWQVVVTEYHSISSKDGIDWYPVDTGVNVYEYGKALLKVADIVRENTQCVTEPWDRPDGWVLRNVGTNRIDLCLEIVRVKVEDR